MFVMIVVDEINEWIFVHRIVLLMLAVLELDGIVIVHVVMVPFVVDAMQVDVLCTVINVLS